MKVTAADLAALKRHQAQPQRAPGELVAVFVAGKLKNPLNGPQWGGQKFSQMRYRQEWHARVAMALLEAGWQHLGVGNKAAKNITIVGTTHNQMDRDGLLAALKPVIDALVKCGVIHDDKEATGDGGHVIACTQRIDRARRGVEIRVSLRAPASREARDGGMTDEGA